MRAIAHLDSMFVEPQAQVARGQTLENVHRLAIGHARGPQDRLGHEVGGDQKDNQAHDQEHGEEKKNGLNHRGLFMRRQRGHTGGIYRGMIQVCLRSRPIRRADPGHGWTGRDVSEPPWKESAVKAARICTGALIWIGLPLFMAVSGGCQTRTSGVPMSSSAMDVTAQPTYTPAPSYSPTPAQPVYDSVPVVASAVTPAYSSSSTGTGAIGAGGTYVVKKGDTLYGIARKNYGDGKQWQKIVAANPGLSPTSLKVGQTIMLP